MGISIGMVGLGAFGTGFAYLFCNHPAVDRIALCDREPDRIEFLAQKEAFARKFAPRDAYASLDEICRADLDALVIITQPWLHAPQCVQAMESGKDVYSAVPIVSLPDSDEILAWCDRLIDTCRRTGQRYMLGETTYYRPEAMFCRRQAAAGAFGDFVYAEGQYHHDVAGLRSVKAHREAGAAGREWLELKKQYQERGFRGGPMHYPTHSTSGPVCVMKSHARKATAYGYRNRTGDPFFEDNAFSNEVALFQMSNGAAVRICECREIGRLGTESFSILGTRGAFWDNIWSQRPLDTEHNAGPAERSELRAADMRDPLPPAVTEAFTEIDFTGAFPAGTNVDFLHTGHGGSHPYLVHEFVDAVAAGRQPAVNAWEAARYMAMGATAHKSALRGGETLDVPDWGDAPH